MEPASAPSEAGDTVDPSDQRPPHPLQYASRRRSVAGAIVAAVILAVLVASLTSSSTWLIGRYEQWQRNRAFRSALRSCLKTTSVSRRVVYEEDPQRAATMIAADSAYRSTPFFLTAQTNAPVAAPLPQSLPLVAMRHSRSWDRLKWYYSPIEGTGVAFVGERRTPTGETVLFCVEIFARRQQLYEGPIETTRQLRAWVIRRANAPPIDEIGDANSIDLDERLIGPRETGQPLPPIRLFEGEIDPTAPSRVQVPFQRLDTGERGVISCEIDGANSVEFSRAP
jgi:hypothetical protein